MAPCDNDFKLCVDKVPDAEPNDSNGAEHVRFAPAASWGSLKNSC